MSNYIELSIIIPAYNEANRLPRTLQKTFFHLRENFSSAGFEVLVANDGSKDGTAEEIKKLSSQYPELKLLDYRENRGRGAVCQKAVSQTRGRFVLIMDADGSTDTKFIRHFFDYLQAHPEIHILTGSRDIEGARVLTPQIPLRVFMYYIFLLMAKVLFGWPMHDRINGFKMFRRETALDIYPHQTETSVFAEAELVYIAEIRGWKVRELPIEWRDDRDSRVKPLREAWRSFWGMFKIAIRGKRGFYN